MGISQTMCKFSDVENPILTGGEHYKIITSGNYIVDDILNGIITSIIKSYAGLPLHSVCALKSIIAHLILKKLNITSSLCYGSFYIYATDGLSNYGCEYIPPYEYHAWLAVDDIILDMGLPGMIHIGENTKDSIGPFVTGWEPSIMASKSHPLLQYKQHVIFEDGAIALDAEIIQHLENAEKKWGFII